jgi:hypothetical protein
VKVGDLVRLSAYGLKAKYNFSVIKDGDQVGIITKVTPLCHGEVIYRVRWSKTTSISSWVRYNRRELKYAR